MSILIIFGATGIAAGIAESIQETIYWHKKRRAWNERRYNMRHRVIA